jgi:hypothetical protein
MTCFVPCSPAKAGAQLHAARFWAPAFAGEQQMTSFREDTA